MVAWWCCDRRHLSEESTARKNLQHLRRIQTTAKAEAAETGGMGVAHVGIGIAFVCTDASGISAAAAFLTGLYFLCLSARHVSDSMDLQKKIDGHTGHTATS